MPQNEPQGAAGAPEPNVMSDHCDRSADFLKSQGYSSVLVLGSYKGKEGEERIVYRSHGSLLASKGMVHAYLDDQLAGEVADRLSPPDEDEDWKQGARE